MHKIFIDSDKKLDLIVKSLKLNLSKNDHDYLVCHLYHHIEYTRRKSYGNGYEQGKFDERMHLSHLGKFTLSHNTK